MSTNGYAAARAVLLPYRKEGGIMKPIKRRASPPEPQRGEPEGGEGGDVELTRWNDRVDSIEGEEGNGGAYGRPRAGDEDEPADRSEERG